jgi:hypothetical protein
MKGEPEYEHFTKWTPRTRKKSTTTAPESTQWNAKSFEILKAEIYKAFAPLPAAREAFCHALAEFNRLTTHEGITG